MNGFCVCTVGHSSLVANFVEFFNKMRFWESPIVYRELLPLEADLFNDGDYCGDYDAAVPTHAIYFEESPEDRNAARYSQIVNSWRFFAEGAYCEKTQKWNEAKEFFAQ